MISRRGFVTGAAGFGGLAAFGEAKVELFCRVALNVFGHNRDDHLKNFSFLMDRRGRWTLAPFYDFTRADGPNGWHTLSVSGEGANPGADDLRRLAGDVGLSRTESDEVIGRAESALRHLRS